MKKIFCLVGFILLIQGCGFSQKPAWLINSSSKLETFKTNFLLGAEPSVTETNFAEAIEEIKKSGDLDLLQKAWLTRMALQTAVLKDMEEGDYRKIAAVKTFPENDNFYAFLKGDISAVDPKLLPEQYREFSGALLKGDVLKTGKAIASMKDEPVSRLIAAGVALRGNIESEAIIQTAVETCSINGWKMALIAWLERLAAFYERAGETGKAAEVRGRIELIEE
jgi:hypothetical protein